MKAGARWISAAACSGLLLAALGHGNLRANPNPGARPSLLLVVIDTWRWDYLGASGEGRVATPVLDALAREGLYAREVVTPCPMTTPSHATMFTGLLPLHHRVLDCIHYRLPDGIPTLAETFRNAGYATGAVVSGEPLKKRFRLDRGFETYDDAGIQKSTTEHYASGSRDGAASTQAALKLLAGFPAGHPAFLWVHYFDLHTPYRSRPGWDAKYPKKPYASQVAFVDAEIGRLLGAVRSDRNRAWRVVVVGDHGEGLWDHDEYEHGVGLYRSTLDVPLILSPRPESPVRCPGPWSLMDLAPTLLEWFRLPALKGVDGRSLFSAGAPGRDIPCLSLMPSLHYGVNPILGLRRGDWMYMRHGAEELYDLRRDPSEASDLSSNAAARGKFEELRKACADVLPYGGIEEILNPTLEGGLGEMAALFSLGYVGGPVTQLNGLQRADIRTLLADIRALDAERLRCQSRKDKEPLKVACRAFLRKYPRCFYGLRSYSLLLLELKEFDEAEAVLTAAARVNPGDAMTLTDLGNIKMGRGRYGEARVLFEKVLESDPGSASANLNLGILYERGLKQPERAVPYYEAFLRAAPKSPEAERVRKFLRGVGSGPAK